MTRAEAHILEHYAGILKNLKVSVNVKSRYIKFDFEPTRLPKMSRETYKKYYTHPLGFTYVVGDIDQVREFLRPLLKLMKFRSENMELPDFILSENYRFEGGDNEDKKKKTKTTKSNKTIYVEDYVFGVNAETFENIRIKIENGIITKLSLIDGYKKYYLDSKHPKHLPEYHLPEGVRNACAKVGICLLFWSLRTIECVGHFLDASFNTSYDWLEDWINRWKFSQAHTIRYG